MNARLRGFLIVFGAIFCIAGLCHKPPDDIPIPVNVSHNSGRSQGPSIAVSSQGTVHLVWNDDTDRPDGDAQIYYAWKPLGGVWSEPVNVFPSGEYSRFPSIAVGPGDRLHLAWQDASPGNWYIFYMYRDPGGQWSVPETLGSGLDVAPHVAVDSGGAVNLVWSAGGYYSWFMFARKPAGSTWSTPIAISPRAEKGDAGLAVDRSGRVFVAWEQFDDPLAHAYYVMRGEQGAWTAPAMLPPTKGYSFQPGVAADPDGGMHFVWVDSAMTHLYRYPDGQWAPREHVDGGTAGIRSIAVDDSGTLYVPYGSVELRRKRRGQPWDEAISVDGDSVGSGPVLAIDHSGRKCVVWDRSIPGSASNNDLYYTEVSSY